MSDLVLSASSKAFGDGQHATTKMVLAALEAMDADAFAPRVACDMGCGSGILSLAIARKFKCPVIAVDVLHESVGATRANAATNGFDCHPGAGLGPIPGSPEAGAGASGRRSRHKAGLTPAILPIHSDGFKHPDISAHAPYDLIVMNILAEPLLALAADAAAHLAAGGVLILSGIFLWQGAQITKAYEALTLERTTRLQLGDWLALGFQKP